MISLLGDQFVLNRYYCSIGWENILILSLLKLFHDIFLKNLYNCQLMEKKISLTTRKEMLNLAEVRS
jgi:hypothetical protein